MSIHGGKNQIFFVTRGKLFGMGGNTIVWDQTFYQVYRAASDGFRLGQGKDEVSTVPVEIKIPGSPKILIFNNAFGSSATIVLTVNGLFGCGEGSYGKFGTTDCSDVSQMKILGFYKGLDVENYFSSGFALWVLLSGGTILRSGFNNDGQLGNGGFANLYVPEKLDTNFLSSGERVIDIKTSNHSLLLTDKGNVFACGDGQHGKRGMGIEDIDVVRYKLSFEKIKFLQESVCETALAWEHSLFRNFNGSVYSCGYGKNGRIGHNDKSSKSIPTKLDGLANVRCLSVACGKAFSMFLNNRYEAFSCGNSKMYQTGLGTTQDVFTPTKVKTTLRIVAMALSYESSSFVTSDGDVFSVGSNSHGQIGCGSSVHDMIKSLTKTKFELTLLIGKTLFVENPKKLTDVQIVLSA